MNRVPEPPLPEQASRFLPDPDKEVVALEENKRGAPVWAVLVIMFEATLLICMVASVVVLALFGKQLAERAGGAATTVAAGAGPVSSSMGFYYMLDSHYYGFAHEALASNLATEYSKQRLQDEWESMEDSEGRTLPLPTNVQMNGDRATVSILLSAARTNRTYSVELTLEKGYEETWYIIDADPVLIPAP